MQATNRPLILAALLALGAVAQLAPAATVSAPPRWPASKDVFEVAGWSAGEARIDSESREGVAFVNVRYISADSRLGAVLGLATSTNAKRIYRAGPEVPFAGAGYTITAPPDGLVPANDRRSVFRAVRGNESLLVFATHGERRGLVGNGPLAWTLAALDGVLGQPNDYFEASLAVPVALNDARAAHDGAALADSTFAQIAAAYSR